MAINWSKFTSNQPTQKTSTINWSKFTEPKVVPQMSINDSDGNWLKPTPSPFSLPTPQPITSVPSGLKKTTTQAILPKQVINNKLSEVQDDVLSGKYLNKLQTPQTKSILYQEKISAPKKDFRESIFGKKITSFLDTIFGREEIDYEKGLIAEYGRQQGLSIDEIKKLTSITPKQIEMGVIGASQPLKSITSKEAISLITKANKLNWQDIADITSGKITSGGKFEAYKVIAQDKTLLQKALAQKGKQTFGQAFEETFNEFTGKAKKLFSKVPEENTQPVKSIGNLNIAEAKPTESVIGKTFISTQSGREFIPVKIEGGLVVDKNGNKIMANGLNSSIWKEKPAEVAKPTETPAISKDLQPLAEEAFPFGKSSIDGSALTAPASEGGRSSLQNVINKNYNQESIDLYNKLNGTNYKFNGTPQPLAEEAKKYKSAEEFVNSKKPKDLSNQIADAKKFKTPEEYEKAVNSDPILAYRAGYRTIGEAKNELRNLGRETEISKLEKMGEVSTSENTMKMLEDLGIKTDRDFWRYANTHEQKLTDIWNKANATLPEKATAMPVGEVKLTEEQKTSMLRKISPEGQQKMYLPEAGFGKTNLFKQIEKETQKFKLTDYDTPEIIKARISANEIPITININTPERNTLRQKIANDFYGNGALKKEKRLDLIIGSPASGKSTFFTDPLIKQYGSMLIDSDQVKKVLPEFNNGIGAGATHQESALISDILILEKAIKNGDNIVFPRLGKNVKSMEKLIDEMVASGYSVHIHFMDLPANEATKRVVTRFNETGRFVDPNYVLNVVDGKPKIVYNKIKNRKGVKSYEQFSNDVPKGQQPKFIEKGENKTAFPAGRERLQRYNDYRNIEGGLGRTNATPDNGRSAKENEEALIGQEQITTKDKPPLFDETVFELEKEFNLTPEEERAIMEDAFGIKEAKGDIMFGDDEIESGYKNFKEYAKTRKWMYDTDTDVDIIKRRIQSINVDNKFFEGAKDISSDDLLIQFKDRLINEKGGIDTLVTGMRTPAQNVAIRIKKIRPDKTDKQIQEISKDIIGKYLPMVISGDNWIWKASEPVKVPTAKQMLRMEAKERARVLKAQDKYLAGIQKEIENQFKIVGNVKEESFGNTEFIIEKLKANKISDEMINDITLENGIKLVDTVKIKREANGFLSAVITKQQIADIKKSYTEDISIDKWTKKSTLKDIKGLGSEGVKLYRISQIFFENKGLKPFIFDPIRQAERGAEMQRTEFYSRFEKAGLFKKGGWFTSDRFNLSKTEAENIGKYYIGRQKPLSFNIKLDQLSSKEKKFVEIFDGITKDTEERFFEVAKKNGKEPSKVENYAPLMTGKDFELVDKAGALDFIFRKHPAFFSLKERAENVPAGLYEKDYREVATRWIQGLTDFNSIGDISVEIKYLINSQQFKDVVKEKDFEIVNNWLKNVLNPDIPKYPALAKGLGLGRKLMAYSSLGLNYATIAKQPLTLVPITLIDKAPPKFKSNFAKAFGINTKLLPTITERKGDITIKDLQGKIGSIFTGGITQMDKKAAVLALNSYIDKYAKEVAGWTSKNQVPVSKETMDLILRKAQDRIDMWFGGMTKAQVSSAFRGDVGRFINLFMQQLTSQLNGFYQSVYEAKGFGKKSQKTAEVLVAAIVIAYLEQVITNLSPEWDDEDDMAKDVLISLLGNIPIVSQVVYSIYSGQELNLVTGTSGIVNLIRKISDDTSDFKDITFAGLETLGTPKTFRRVWEGMEILEKGGITDKNGTMLAPIKETDEIMRSFLRGKYGSVAANDWISNIGKKTEDRDWFTPQVEFLQNGNYYRKIEILTSLPPEEVGILMSYLSVGQLKKLQTAQKNYGNINYRTNEFKKQLKTDLKENPDLDIDKEIDNFIKQFKN